MKILLLVFVCFIAGLRAGEIYQDGGSPKSERGGEACLLDADVAIILDKSMSIGESNFNDLKKVLVKFVDKFQVSEDRTHIALLTFNDWVQVAFPLTEFKTNGAVKEGILKMSSKLYWNTRTDRALRKLEREIFTEKGGDRPDRPNYAFVFTDGKPTGQNKEFFEPVSKVVSRLEAQGVTIIAVGFGKKINPDTLKDLAGRKGHYCVNDLFEKVAQIESATCGPHCINGLDLGVIADLSKSVKLQNIPKLKQALQTIADELKISANGTHMGLITFAKDADMLFSFADTKYQNPVAAKQRISQINKLFLDTRTDKALIMANDELFTAAGGDRPDKPNVLLVFTDGKPTPMKGYKDFDETVPPLLAKGVKLNAVEIGNNVNKKVLAQIAGEGGNFTMVDDLDKLLEELRKVKQMACGQ